MNSIKFSTLFLAIIIMSCGNENSNNDSKKNLDQIVEIKDYRGFEALVANSIGIDFVNDIQETEEVNHLTWDAIYYGGGVAIGDVNNDGLSDLFFSGNNVNDALYINKGDFSFENVSTLSGIDSKNGWSTGVAMVDINGDSFMDIYVCRSSWKMDADDPSFKKNVFWINNGDGTFTDKAEEMGLDDLGCSTQSSFFDYDHDGDLDMFLLNSPSNNLAQKVLYSTGNEPDYAYDRLFNNNGDGTFKDVSEFAGVKAFSFGLGLVTADVNHDGWVDIYVANDYERPDYCYINNRDGTFSNNINDLLKHTSFTAMGCDVADVNNDALVDIGVLDMQAADHVRSKTNMPSMQPENFWKYVAQGYNYQYMTNVLQINNGYGYYSDMSQLAGLASTDWSWSLLMADFDLDGWRDIYITNGINRDMRNNDFALEFQKKLDENQAVNLFELSKETPSTKLENYMFKNNGDYTFDKVVEDWGLSGGSFSFGAAYGDLDNDGDLDLVVNNNEEAPFIFKNAASGNYLKVSINGKNKNIDGIGTKVLLFNEGKKQYGELVTVRGFQSSVENKIHFGLGSHASIDSLIAIFDDGTVIKKYDVKANQEIVLDQNQSRTLPLNVYDLGRKIFNLKDEPVVKFVHQENEYDDYEHQIILPHKQTTSGPFIAKADVNGDKLDDVFIGGAKSGESALFIQSTSGEFRPSSASVFSSDRKFEDEGCAFFDIDQDGDQDLFVASGGSEYAEGHPNNSNRLYLNNGQGEFTRSAWTDEFKLNSSVVVPFDADKDGDLDLFVGGKGQTGHYPYASPSQILLNENGNLIPLTGESADQLNQLGMVRDATIDGSDNSVIYVVGEWMTPVQVSMIDDEIEIEKLGDNLAGWWNSVVSKDLDGDGDFDLVVGNIGVNNKFHVDNEHPLRIYAADFDNNGKNDPVLSKKYKDEFVPVRGRECSSEQMPQISEKFEDFDGFANASIEDVIGSEIDEALFYEVTEFRSGVLMNENGMWVFKPFPNYAQISAINASIVEDFNKDGVQDILITGNRFNAEVETARYDASIGLLLIGKGDGAYQEMPFLHSGFNSPLNAKSMVSINTSGVKRKILVGNNNSRLIEFDY